MDIQQFFKKNLRYVAIILLALFFIKSFQSCNRKMEIRKVEKEIVYVTDSLTIVIDSLKESILERDFLIKDLNNELKVAGVKASEAQRRADAVQSAVEKSQKNTTIKIENKSERDTVSVDKK